MTTFQSWCPKAARGEFARELASVLSRIKAQPDQVQNWVLQGMFARCILPAGRGPRAGDAYSQARLVRERLRRWRAGEFVQLWEEAVELTRERPRQGRPRRRGRPGRRRQLQQEEDEEESQAKKNAERAATLAQDGQYTKALQALTSAGMAAHTRANIEVMREKHPPAAGAPRPLPTTDIPQLVFNQVEVDKGVKRFRRGSAPGPTGLRPEHLRVALQAAPGRKDRALKSLTEVLNVMVGGGVPQEVAPYLAGARLHAALKKDGGLRPIAVGNLLRRLVGKCCVTRLQDRAAGILSPHQVGVGVRGGAEGIVHTARQVLEGDPSLWCAQLDFINAFNLVDRSTALEEVLETFPEILAWVSTCYGQASHLLFGSVILASERGFHQGDPLAALLFCLVLNRLVKHLHDSLPELRLNGWYLDDGTLIGQIDQLRQAVEILEREGPPLGLVLSTAATVPPPGRPKSTIWCPGNIGGQDDPLGKGLVRVAEEGVILLGAPLGSPDFVAKAVREKVEKVRAITGLLPQLEDPHTEFVLLRSCLALPKLSFLLRVVDTSGHRHLLQEFDQVTRESLIRILGTPVHDRAWQQSKLPVSMGGLGLRGAENHGPATYAASVLSSKLLTQSLLGLDHADLGPVPDGEEIQGSLGPELLAAIGEAQGEEALEADLVGLTQRQMSLKVDQHAKQQLIEGVGEEEDRERARLASLGLKHAGDWLNTAPLKALGLHLRAAEFILVAKYRLGLPVFDTAGPCPACLRHSDVFGDHALCCGSGGERISRHNALRDALFETAVAAGLGPTKEGRFLLPGNDRRPADILVPHWSSGQDAAMDVTVVMPLQQAILTGAATTPGFALDYAHGNKVRGAEEECRAQGIAFLPMVAESLGGWHNVAEREVKKLGAALARHTGQDEGEAISHLWGRLGVLLQRGNAAILGNRVPAASPA